MVQYPYFGRHVVDHNLVVLFTQPGSGVCIRADSNNFNQPNRQQSDWVEPNFEYYDWTKDRFLSEHERQYFCRRSEEFGIPVNAA